jgi:hypothetical protein
MRIAGFIVLLLASACMTVQPRLAVETAAARAKWEYRQESQCFGTSVPPQTVTAANASFLNHLGDDRWELISVVVSPISATENCWIMTLRRRDSSSRDSSSAEALRRRVTDKVNDALTPDH